MNCLMDAVFLVILYLSEICSLSARELIQGYGSYFVDNRLYCAITEQVKNL